MSDILTLAEISEWIRKEVDAIADDESKTGPEKVAALDFARKIQYHLVEEATRCTSSKQ